MHLSHFFLGVYFLRHPFLVGRITRILSVPCKTLLPIEREGERRQLLPIPMKQLLLPLLAVGSLLTHADEQPPNIVFLMTDDQRCDTLGCYGRPEFETQHIDQLSQEGVTFDNAYHTVAICMPSRVTAMTGRYFASHNSGFTYPHNTPVSDADFAQTYHAVLKAAGYRSGFIGKFGFCLDGGLDTLKQHFDFYDAHGGHTNFGHGKWADTPDAFKGLSAARERTERTIKKGDSMIRFIETQPKDQPFVLSVSFDAVKHDSDNDMHIPDKAYFEEKTISVPGNYYEGANPTFPEVVKKHARGVPLHLHYSGTPEKYQRMARRFASQGRTVDSQVKRLRDKLDELGLSENTIIIYTSDNGRYIGSHGLHDKALLHEESVKAPLIIWDGRGMKRKGEREPLLTSSTDLAPTILALAGADIPDSMQGRSLTGLLDNTADRENWRDAVFMENLFLQEMHAKAHKAKKAGVEIDLHALNAEVVAENRSYRSRGIRTAKWKYFIYYEHTPVVEELYDLEADPLEMNNLAASAEHAATLTSLREKTQELYEKFKKD